MLCIDAEYYILNILNIFLQDDREIYKKHRQVSSREILYNFEPTDIHVAWKMLGTPAALRDSRGNTTPISRKPWVRAHVNAEALLRDTRMEKIIIGAICFRDKIENQLNLLAIKLLRRRRIAFNMILNLSISHIVNDLFKWTQERI